MVRNYRIRKFGGLTVGGALAPPTRNVAPVASTDRYAPAPLGRELGRRRRLFHDTIVQAKAIRIPARK